MALRNSILLIVQNQMYPNGWVGQNLWGFLIKRKTFSRKRGVSLCSCALPYRTACLVAGVYLTCLWNRMEMWQKKWNRSQQYHSSWINANVTYVAFIMLRSVYFCFHWFFLFCTLYCGESVFKGQNKTQIDNILLCIWITIILILLVCSYC